MNSDISIRASVSSLGTEHSVKSPFLRESLAVVHVDLMRILYVTVSNQLKKYTAAFSAFFKHAHYSYLFFYVSPRRSHIPKHQYYITSHGSFSNVIRQ